MTKATARLRVRMAPGRAQQVAQALRPDDDANVTARTEGEDLVVDVVSTNVLGLARGLEDVLANVAIAQEVDEAASRSQPRANRP